MTRGIPSRSGRPWRRLTARIVRRDGGICHLCGKPGATSADHLVPVSRGGTNDPSNLKAAHPYCNRVRSNRSIELAQTQLTTQPTEGWTW